MDKKLKIIIATILSVILLLAAVIGCVAQWFYSPGIHQLFGYTHIEYEVTGYRYASNASKILEQTTFSIDTTVTTASTKVNADEALTLHFGDQLCIGSPDPECAYTVLISDQTDGGHHITINRRSREYGQTETTNDGIALPSTTNLPPLYLYLDANGEIQTFWVSSEKEEQYFLVFTDDPSEAKAYLDEILSKYH